MTYGGNDFMIFSWESTYHA